MNQHRSSVAATKMEKIANSTNDRKTGRSRASFLEKIERERVREGTHAHDTEKRLWRKTYDVVRWRMGKRCQANDKRARGNNYSHLQQHIDMDTDTKI